MSNLKASRFAAFILMVGLSLTSTTSVVLADDLAASGLDVHAQSLTQILIDKNPEWKHPHDGLDPDLDVTNIFPPKMKKDAFYSLLENAGF